MFFLDVIVSLYVNLISSALPVGIVWWFCDLIVTTFLRAFTGGFLKVGVR